MWMYKGKELNDEDIPPKSIGFIYLIIQISTGRKYIGKKLLTMAGTKTTKGVKKKIRKCSDWKNYWSSSPWLIEYIKEHGTGDFTREILVFCSSRGSLLYNEELSLFSVGALESDDYINSNIRSKIYTNWVKVPESDQLRGSLKQLGLVK